jgi:RNA polymerase sigma factor (sigma-70 family)
MGVEIPVSVGEQTREAEARALFGDHVRQYQDAAFASAYAILNDRAAAEDATQAAFMTAWLRRNDLRESRAFGAWLRTIVRTECFRILRCRRVVNMSLDDLAAEPTEPAKPATDRLRTLELREVLLEGLASLSESDRSVLVLRYMSDLSYEQMAEYLDVPVSTVKKRLHDARKRLLAWFKGLTASPRARSVLREYRPSRDRRFEHRMVTLADFLDKVVRGDASAVAAALDAQPELRDAKGEGQPLWRGLANALTVAAACGRAEVVRLLIDRGAPIDPNPPDLSPIVTAAIEGHAEIVSILREAGAKIDLFAACALGDYPSTVALLAANPQLVHARTFDRKTPLHFCRSVDVAQALIAAGARAALDLADDAGRTPLQWIGATGRYTEVCRYLMTEGATADSSDIFTACSIGDVVGVTRLLDEDPSLIAARLSGGGTPLHVAAGRGENEVAALLIARGADLNARGGESAVTPLHTAAAGGHTDMAKALVTAGADMTLRDGSFGATPAEWARFFGHTALFDVLTKRSG